jgi:hypothetical protein
LIHDCLSAFDDWWAQQPVVMLNNREFVLKAFVEGYKLGGMKGVDLACEATLKIVKEL